jgi:hypothetical protein
MNATQIKYAFDKYGTDTLLQVQLNNTKRIYASSQEERDNLQWNHELELVEFKESSFNGIKVDYVVPYEFIEALIFKDDMNQKSFNMDGNKLATDEKGQLRSNW